MNRFFRASLAAAPEVRTAGSFGGQEERLVWDQPQDLWQGLVLRHGGTLSLNGYRVPIAPLDILVIPPGSRCEIVRSGLEEYTYTYFNFRPEVSEQDVVALPMQTNLGAEGAWWDVNLRRAISRLQFTKSPLVPVVSALLWAIAVPARAATKSVYVSAAEQIIEARLGQELRLSEISRELNVSQSQLNRLFLAEHGRTPMQFVRDRRAQLAHQLLSSTTHPIKQIAQECGYSDLHAFNRFARHRLGASPRAIRAGRAAVDLFRISEYRP